MMIEPTEKRDQHCKIYVEKSLKDQISYYANKNGMTFSQAGRKLIIFGIDSVESIEV